MKKNEQRVYLSRDLKPNRKDELKRITNKGGFVSSDGRLLGNIAVSRAFGDWKFKDKSQYNLLKLNNSNNFDEYLISNRAEFRIWNLKKEDDYYVVLSSDGIFQNWSDNQIFAMINKEINSGIEDKESHVKNISNIVNSIRYNILTTKSEGKNRENADNMTFIMIEI
jgi:serine/threonine protein phosphatase PrpC